MKIKRNKKKVLRIAHYNILKGGEGKLEEIAKVIQDIDPDICGILEAVGWQNKRKYFKNYVKKLGYKYFDLALANSKYNIAVLSKIPILIKHIKKGFKHVVVKVVIEKGNKKRINIFFVHLSPVSEDERLKELENLSKYINKKEKTIIMGDLNSLSLYDQYNQKKLLDFFKKNNIIKFGINKLHFDVISKIESLDFIDSVKYLKQSFDFSVPTSFNVDVNHSMKLRLDYAFLEKNVIEDLQKVKIFKNKISEEASDHYPFFIELK